VPGELQSRLPLALNIHTSFPRTRESTGTNHHRRMGMAVIPAHAGIQEIGTDHWIPDVSGMTEEIDVAILRAGVHPRAQAAAYPASGRTAIRQAHPRK